MRRTSWAMLAGLLLLLPASGRAADQGPAGNWKMSLFLEGKMQLLWLVQIDSADGKVTAKLLESAEGAPKATVGNAKVTDGTLRFTVKIGTTSLAFEGQVPKGDAKLITGNLAQAGGRAMPAELERTTLKALDAFDLAKEDLAKATGFEVAATGLKLLQRAGDHKAKVEEVRSWADKAAKAAEPYRAAVQTDITLQIASTLSQQEGYADVALNYARRAERGLDPKASRQRTVRTLEVLASALKAAGKTDDAKEVEGRLAKLTEVTPKPFAGRKAKTDRAILVELFTGAQCPPCVAADLAFDALAKTYKPSEVILLEYHDHIPGPDPLTIATSRPRLEYYEGEGTPTLVFNGKAPSFGAGGGKSDAPEIYDQCVEELNPLLEEPARALLKATVTRKENKIDIAIEVGDVAKPGANLRLRLALVEESINYQGTNGVSGYHHVVRDMPGGVNGFAVKERTSKHSATVDLDEVKKGLKKYLDNQTDKGMKFPGKVPEVELKNLRVVAFLQNDQTREILQAVQVDVKSEK